MRVRVGLILCILALVSGVPRAGAQGMPYLCEIGLQGGCGYYVGDGSPHIFMNPREAYGIHFRYKFTKRWALQAKVSGQRITGNVWSFAPGTAPVRTDKMWENQIISGDIVAEFNFFRYDAANKYDKRIKPYSPYIFIGIGGSMYNGEGRPMIYDKETGKWFPEAWRKKPSTGMYIPLGIGFKWKFHDRCGLNIAWQHNIYIPDDLEAQTSTEHSLNNRFHMNGMNIMNCDVTGMLTVALVIEFAKAKAPCRICNE